MLVLIVTGALKPRVHLVRRVSRAAGVGVGAWGSKTSMFDGGEATKESEEHAHPTLGKFCRPLAYTGPPLSEEKTKSVLSHIPLSCRARVMFPTEASQKEHMAAYLRKG